MCVTSLVRPVLAGLRGLEDAVTGLHASELKSSFFWSATFGLQPKNLTSGQS